MPTKKTKHNCLVKCSILGLLLIMASHAQAILPVLDLSEAQWQYHIGAPTPQNSASGNELIWQNTTSSNVLSNFKRENATNIVWYHLQIPLSQIPAMEYPGLLLGKMDSTNQVFINDKLIGTTGVFVSSAREYRGTAYASITHIHRIDPTLLRARDVISLSIRMQSLSGAPKLNSQQILIGDAGELFIDSRNADLLIWVRDSVWMIILLVGTLISFVSIIRTHRRQQHFWLPFVMATAILVFIPHSIMAEKFGWASFSMIIVSAFSPLLFFVFLHLANIINIRLSRIEWLLIGLSYACWPLAIVFDASIKWIIIGNQLADVATLLAFLLIGLKIRKTQRLQVPICPWIQAAFVAMTMFFIVKVFWPDIDSLLGWTQSSSAHLFALVAVIGFLMALSDTHRQDRAALQQVTSELLVAQENERQRLSNELHIGISQRISQIAFHLKQLLDVVPPETKQQLQTPLQELSETNQEINALVQALKPVALDGIHFSQAIISLVESWRHTTDASISFKMTGEKEPEDEIQAQLFRIIQEVVHNALKHANAKKIDIRLNMSSPANSLSIIDDGIGFDPKSQNSGFGLKTIAERCQLIGGNLQIESASGKGTKINMTFGYS